MIRRSHSLAPVVETVFPARAPFFFQVRLGPAEDSVGRNLPVPPVPPPHAHEPETGR
jgi:hypothetical protein